MVSALTCPSEVILCEILRAFVREVIDQPSVSERAVRYVGDVELLCSCDQVVGLVQSLESGVLGLNGVDLGDCEEVVSYHFNKRGCSGTHWSLLCAES